jgi:hypothetical protein
MTFGDRPEFLHQLTGKKGGPAYTNFANLDVAIYAQDPVHLPIDPSCQGYSILGYTNIADPIIFGNDITLSLGPARKTALFLSTGI